MEKDLLTKRFLSDNARFADLLNGIIFQGEAAVAPEDLQEMDTRTGLWHLPGALYSNGKRRAKQREKQRDLVRKMACGASFVVCGLENQEEVDYSLPLRGMSYDAGEYQRQAALERRKVRRSGRKLTSGEYLYGFAKDSCLHPTVTLVLYTMKVPKTCNQNHAPAA